ncbi:MAG: class I poly(R)-hydroxyalkanoic acid synthase [Halocynthiibacter sp.]
MTQTTTAENEAKTAEADKDLAKMNANIARIEELSKRLVSAMSDKKSIDPSLQGPGTDIAIKAATAYAAEMMGNPAKILEQQVSYWGKSLRHYVEAQDLINKGKFVAPTDPTPKDRRFSNPLWDTHPYFNFLKQQYMINTDAMRDMVEGLDGLDAKERDQIEFFSEQIMNLMAPTNFLATNPDALNKAVETEGQSLVDGLENMVRDIEENDGELLVTLADKKAFTVGENIASSEGKVVFRNKMFELIQYAPTTKTVKTTPIVVFPPWINKFYILDLKPQNSFIKWVVDQGYTLFVVSWVNPDQGYADVGMDTYVEEGFIRAISEVKSITGEKQVNAVGYCIAGTTLSLTLALMEKRGDSSVKSATYFTTLTDFSDQGEVGVFLDNSFVDGIEREVAENGILRSLFMSRTFSYMRSNDLVYGPAIKSYMMGEAPPAFDLLYWNGDSTNLPARMAVEYLRWLCQGNRLAEGTIELCGETLSLADIQVPICAIACETDHIAAWKASFNGMAQFGSKDKTFILSESGHIAGIVNPPSKNKYGHYTNKGPVSGAPEAWQASADFNQGSWWPLWETWVAGRSGAEIAARAYGDSEHPVLCDAPGTYVTA